MAPKQPKKKATSSHARGNKVSNSSSSEPFLYRQDLKLVSLVIALIAVGVGYVFRDSIKVWGQDAITRISTANVTSSFSGASERRQAEMRLMEADMASEYEIKNAEEISPYVKYLKGPPMHAREQRAMGAKFRSFYPFAMSMWWDDGTEKGVYSGNIKAFGDTATNTYTTHTFHFRHAQTNELVASFTMNDDAFLYVLGPEEGNTEVLNSKRYKETMDEVQFMKKYHDENGVPWLSHYPRPPPIVFMYPADFPGQVHKVRSYVGYYDANGEQSSEPIDFDITVVSSRPRVIIIRNLLSEYEIDHIVSMGEKIVKDSMVGSGDGGFKSNTRTSATGWLSRKDSSVLDRIYYRFADVLGMNDEQLQDNGNGNVENLQFVRYEHLQKYDAHHDFGNTGSINQRFSTLLIYLKVPQNGGGTSFPKAFDGQGIEVKPRAGDAVLFYNMLPDGNGDDLSLHSGMPVYDGVKYVCNLWTWDPKRGY